MSRKTKIIYLTLMALLGIAPALSACEDWEHDHDRRGGHHGDGYGHEGRHGDHHDD